MVPFTLAEVGVELAPTVDAVNVIVGGVDGDIDGIHGKWKVICVYQHTA